MWNDENSTNTGATDNIAIFIVNGEKFEVESGANLKEQVLAFARNAGYSKFRFYINDEEVAPHEAPETVEGNTYYKIVPYDKAG